MRIFADKQTIKQTDTNSKTEPHSYPLWILGERANNEENSLCKCRISGDCPLEGKCLTKNIIYRAVVVSNNNEKEEGYIGLTGDIFKSRYANHLKSFRHEKYKNDTCLSSYIWDLKDKEIDYSIK